MPAVKAGQPFPTNLDTVSDATQVTGLRVDLAKPDCAARPNDCADVAVLNQLDGFNIQPRISIPFSGAIDLATVSRLDDLPRRARRPRRRRQPVRVGAGREHAAFRERRAAHARRRRTCSWSPAACAAPTASSSTRRPSATTSTTGTTKDRCDQGVSQGAQGRAADGDGRWREPERHRRREPLHDTVDHARSRARSERSSAAARADLPARQSGERTVFPLSSVDLGHLARQVDHDPDVHDGWARAAAPRRRRDAGLRLLRLARLRDAGEGHPASAPQPERRSRRDRTTSSSPSSCRPARAPRGRLARRDLRARVRRLEERRAAGGRGHARAKRHRDRRDQRRRPRRRLARHLHGRPAPAGCRR